MLAPVLSGQYVGHNGPVNGYPQATACPQCGNSGGVHSIQELAGLARAQLGQAQPQPGSVPGYAQDPQPGPLPGYMQDPRPGPLPGRGGGGFGPMPRALPPQAEAMLRTQIAIADKHPDVCACLNDGVIFLAGGQRALPMPNLAKLTVEQADDLVAALRSG